MADKKTDDQVLEQMIADEAAAKAKPEVKSAPAPKVDEATAEAVRKQTAAEAGKTLDQIGKIVAGPMLTPAQAAKPGETLVDCVVPKKFILTMDDHRRVQFEAGIERVPQSLVDHWYVKANKVKAR
jgi:hypothetical protein